ncbi:MAG: toll/interleukin-1 receptor domain-containing protein [Nostoc sp. SerVER01]|nr:TIR domain-containing protein [Nostoc sp. SerVER01]
MNEPKVPQIFIAHASEDKPIVRELYTLLKQSGFNPWLDEKELLPGQNWRDEIPKALRKSDLLIVCLSSQSVSKRGYVQREFKQALNLLSEMPTGTIYLIPLKLDDCEIPDLRQNEYGINLRDIQWLNYWEENGYERLVMSIKHQWENQGNQLPESNYNSSSENMNQRDSGSGDDVADTKQVNHFYYEKSNTIPSKLNSIIEPIAKIKDIFQQQLNRYQERYDQVNKLSRELSTQITRLESAFDSAYDEEKKIGLEKSIAEKKAKREDYEQELYSLEPKISSLKQKISNDC